MQCMDKPNAYAQKTVRTSHAWFAHQRYTGLLALHPEYRSGRDNYEWNKAHNAFPKVGYSTSINDVLGFVKRHHKSHMVCQTVQECPERLKNERGYIRAANDSDIDICSRLLIDIDLKSQNISDSLRAALLGLVRHEIGEYFQDLGLQRPAFADTGRGTHILAKYPRVLVANCPDIAHRMARCSQNLGQDFRHELDNLEARIDPVQDLSRYVRIYGTAKPDVGYVSCFCGNDSQEDEALLELLLSYELSDENSTSLLRPVYGATLLTVHNQMPPVVVSLLKRDEKLRDLYLGNNKSSGDTSGSGYDISLVRRLLALGVHDVSMLGTVLALRPNGSVQNSNKDESYIRRTIAKALCG